MKSRAYIASSIPAAPPFHCFSLLHFVSQQAVLEAKNLPCCFSLFHQISSFPTKSGAILGATSIRFENGSTKCL